MKPLVRVTKGQLDASYFFCLRFGGLFLLVLHRQVAHVCDVPLIHRERPPQQTQEEKKEYHKRDHRPDGDVVDASENFFIHSSCSLLVISCSFRASHFHLSVINLSTHTDY